MGNLKFDRCKLLEHYFLLQLSTNVALEKKTQTHHKFCEKFN